MCVFVEIRMMAAQYGPVVFLNLCYAFSSFQLGINNVVFIEVHIATRSRCPNHSKLLVVPPTPPDGDMGVYS